MTKRLAIAAALLSVLGGAPVAQSADRVRGTVVSLDGTALHVTANGGQNVSITLSPSYRVTALVPAKLSDVQAGSFIGIAADTQPDGTLVAKDIAASISGRRAP